MKTLNFIFLSSYLFGILMYFYFIKKFEDGFLKFDSRLCKAGHISFHMIFWSEMFIILISIYMLIFNNMYSNILAFILIIVYSFSLSYATFSFFFKSCLDYLDKNISLYENMLIYQLVIFGLFFSYRLYVYNYIKKNNNNNSNQIL